MLRMSMAISPAPANFAPLLFAGEWARGLEVAQELGYDAVEVSLRDPQDPVVGQLADAAHAHGLPIAAISTGQSYYNDGLSLTSIDEEVQQQLLQRLTGFVEWAAGWDALVVIGGIRGRLEGPPENHAAQHSAAVGMVRRCADYAATRGVRLAIEPINRYETNLIHTVDDALSFIDEVGADNLVILADTFHMNIEEVSMAGALERAGDRLGYVHFADSNRWAPGCGHTPFPTLVHTLQEMGYAGYVGIEVLPLPDSLTAARTAIEHLNGL